jgi:four helix bundle protein
MQNNINDFKDLEVWRKSMQLVKKVYHLTRQFPKSEQYGLTSQIRRSAVSIPSNIAEGHARIGIKEYQHFISIALGSSAELETQIILGQELEYPFADDSEMLQSIQSIRMMLNKLYSSLSRKINKK